MGYLGDIEDAKEVEFSYEMYVDGEPVSYTHLDVYKRQLVYGIGNSSEAVYYLDIGVAECLVVPDEFSVGYQSLTRLAENLRRFFKSAEGSTVTHTVIRKENLFTEENQMCIRDRCGTCLCHRDRCVRLQKRSQMCIRDSL